MWNQVAHPPERQRLPRSLRVMRWVVVAFAGVDLLANLFGPLGVSDHGWSVAVALATTAAVVTTVFLPKLGVLLSAIPLASTFLLNVRTGQDFFPLLTGTLVICAIGSIRSIVLTLTAYTAYAAASALYKESFAAGGMTLTLIAAATVVGMVTRALIRRSNRVQKQITDLHRRADRVGAQERGALADELSALLTDGLAQQNHALTRSLRTRAPDDMRSVLLSVEASSREALAQLRALVSTLRGRDSHEPTSTAVGSSAVIAVVEEAEDLLVGHGHPVTIDDGDWSEEPGDFAGTLLATVVRATSTLVAAHAPPGVECVITIARTPDATRLQISHPLTGEPALLTTPLRSAAERAEATGGTLWLSTDDGRWRLVLSIPARPAPPSASEPRATAAARRRSWWRTVQFERVARWTIILPLVVGTILTGSGALAASQRGDASWHTTALWSLVMLGAALIVWRWWLGIPALVGVLVGSLLLESADVVAGQPAQAALCLLMVIVVLRDGRWGWWIAAGWLVYTVVWFGGLDLRILSLSMSYPAFGVMMGLVAQYFVRLRARQTSLLREATVRHHAARDTVRKELAGELHDIVAHQLSLITMQVGAHGADVGPVTAQRTLERVVAINRSAQADLALLLHVMRNTRETTQPAPDGAWLTPTRSATAAAATLRDAGRRVTLDIDASLDHLDPSTQKTIARIIREATTNILRYSAEDASCSMRASRGERGIEVTITNELPPAPLASEHSSGFGLLGLEERARITGGSLTAGRVGHQWQVQAHLPSSLVVDPSPHPKQHGGVTRTPVARTRREP